MRLMILSAIFFLLGNVSLSQAQGNYSKYINSNGQVSNLVVQCLGLSGIVINGEMKKEKWPEPIYILNSRDLAEVVRVVQGKVNPDVSWFRRGRDGQCLIQLFLPLQQRKY